MILYFADRNMNIIGNASTELSGSYIIVEDTKKEDVDVGVSSFEGRILFSKADRLEVEKFVSVGNTILRYNEEEYRTPQIYDNGTAGNYPTRYVINGFRDVFTIIEAEINSADQTVYFYAEEGGLDLLNNIVGSYYATNQPVSTYVNAALNGTGFIFRDGITSADSSLLSLEWTDTQTIMERLQDIAGYFNYEFAFGYDITGMEITQRWVEFTKERGRDTQEVVTLNREADNILIKKSIANLATALFPIGEDGLTLDGYSYSDSEGDIHVAGSYILSEKALAEWGRYTFENESDSGHIFKVFNCDASTQQDLFEQSLEELKKRRQPEVNYDVEVAYLPDGVGIGDRINIVDDSGELYISGRILKLDTSVTQNKRQITLGEWKIKSSGISAKVQELAAAFKALAANRNFYTWIVYADDIYGTNMSKNSTGKEYIGISTNNITEDFDLEDVSASDFIWSRIMAEDGASVLDVKIFYKNADSEPSPPTQSTEGQTINQIINTVPTGWSETEPGFDVTDPDANLYKVVRIVYSDGTIQFNRVTIDASFNSVKAIYANFDNLVAGTATIGSLDAEYAKIDATNITDLSAQNAWVDSLLVQTGLLAHESTIYTLDAIQLNAANITGGTIDVRRLIFTVNGKKYLFDPTGQYSLTEDTSIVSGKTYYTLVGTAVGSPSASHLDDYYELSDGVYFRTIDTEIKSSKTYYTVVATEVQSPSAGSLGSYYELLTYQKLNGDVIEDDTISTEKLVARCVTAEKITAENLVGTNGWINLHQGKFFYTSNGTTWANTTNGIMWDGTELKIKGSVEITGGSTANDLQRALDLAGNTIIYDHEYTFNNVKTVATFVAHVYRGGEDVTSEFNGEQFTWYYKTEDDEEPQPLNNNTDGNNQPCNYGKTISVTLADMGYGGEIVGKFNTNLTQRLLRTNGDTLTDSGNRELIARTTATGTDVRVRDLTYTTTLTTSDALMVVTSETEKLVTVENLSTALKSSTTPSANGTASAGSEKKYASGDHVHPTDTSRAPVASPSFTGTPLAPTAASGTNTTQIATTAFVQDAISGISGGGSSYTATSPIDITNDVITHEDSGVTAGTYDGGAVTKGGYYIPSITVDAKGHVTSATDLGTLIPVVSSTNTYGVVYSYDLAYCIRDVANWKQRYVLSAGNTTATFTLSDTYGIYVYYASVHDVQCFDATTKEAVIVDWSVDYFTSVEPMTTSINLTVSIAEAYEHDIYVFPSMTMRSTGM